MNIISISVLDQLELLDDIPLFGIAGTQLRDIHHNVWCIILEGDAIKNIKIAQLKHFIDRLIKNRRYQLKCVDSKKNVVFYMWFDKQALQLRFNSIFSKYDFVAQTPSCTKIVKTDEINN
jgi:hypothetical protein